MWQWEDYTDKFSINGASAKEPDMQSSSRGKFSGVGLDGTDTVSSFCTAYTSPVELTSK